MSETKASGSGKGDVNFKKGDESKALKEAIREVREAQKAVQVSLLNDKLARISKLLAVVQV